MNTAQKKKMLRVRNLIEKGWCRGVFARNAANHPVPYQANDACKFCLSGAMKKVNCGFDFECQFDTYIYKNFNAAHTFDFNDRAKDKRTVLRLIDRFIKAT
jgi:hypothetical protein